MTTKHHRRLTLQDIFDVLHKRLPDLRERYGVRSLGVFGSYVRGEQRRDSDVDVLIEFDDDAKPGLFWFIDLQHELSDALGVKVDLVEKKGLKPYIGKRILEEVVYISETSGLDAAQIFKRKSVVLAERKREIRDYLQDILRNIENVRRFVEGVDYDTFASETQTTYAVLHALLIIGEAARKFPADTRRRYSQVPWRKIVGLRNIVAHEYFAVNLPTIWQIINEDLPLLRDTVELIWKEEENKSK